MSGVGDRMARRLGHALASRVRDGTLVIRDADGEATYGSPGPVSGEVTVHHPDAYRELLRGGSAGLGRSYADGLWDTPDLVAFLRTLGRNLDGLNRLRDQAYRATAPVADPIRRRRRPDPERDRRNVRAHYDLGDEFFASFLDPTMTYSCAVFDGDDGDEGGLEAAQRAKLERICAKLDLGPDDHVVEIGSGWGSFALHAAGTRGCRVTTTTVSAAQLETARRRVGEAGLDHLVDVRGDHYRDLDGRYDALVSIEMIEAVDWRDHEDYFATCARLLTTEGRMALQAITIDEARYERARTSQDFIKAHVFPGGCLPSLERIVSTATSVSDLRVRDVEDLTEHYVRTLGCWRERLDAAGDELDRAEVPEWRRRLWRFYLAYCAAGFAERDIGVVQMVLVKAGWRP